MASRKNMKIYNKKNRKKDRANFSTLAVFKCRWVFPIDKFIKVECFKKMSFKIHCPMAEKMEKRKKQEKGRNLKTTVPVTLVVRFPKYYFLIHLIVYRSEYKSYLQDKENPNNSPQS